MCGLIEFASRIKETMESANREPHWGTGEAKRYMDEVALRRNRFEKIAYQYNEDLIQPRIETLANYFTNANVTKNEPPGHSECWFGYCERFPSNTRLAFSIEHDVRFENVAICYDVSMTPLFIRFNEHDRLTVALTEVNEDLVCKWVEERIMEFLDAYLRIDRGAEDFEDEPVIDPVCGMRISRSSATTTDSHCGHPYFFCSEQCRDKFAEDPTHYTKIRTM